MSPTQSKLTVDMVRAALDYDSETGLFRWKKPSGRARVGDIPRANCHGYVAISVHGERHYAHRLAWFHYYGKWPEQIIDHIAILGGGARSDCGSDRVGAEEKADVRAE